MWMPLHHTTVASQPAECPHTTTRTLQFCSQEAPLGCAMVRKTEETVAARSEAVLPARNIATYFLVTTGLELVALPLLCYEFAFRGKVLEGQLENFQGDPQPGALAAALPVKIRLMRERMLSCFLYTGLTVLKQIFNVVLLIGHRKEEPRLLLAWVWGFPALHAAATAVALWCGVRAYFQLDIVSALVLIYLFLISGVVLAGSVVVLVRSARRQLQALAVRDTAAC